MGCGSMDPMDMFLGGASAGAYNILFPSDAKKKVTPKRSLFYTKTLGRARDIMEIYNKIMPDLTALTRRTSESFDPIYGEAAERTRAAELDAFRRYGPEYVQSLSAVHPARTALLDETIGAASRNLGAAGSGVEAARADLALGGELSPQDRLRLEQELAEQASQRGFGYSPSDAGSATLALYLEGERLRQMRLANYNAALDTANRTTGASIGTVEEAQRVIGDPFLAITGRPALPRGSDVTAPPVTGWGGDLFSYGANQEIMKMNYDAAMKASRNAMIGQIAGSVIGAAGMAGGAAI